ncbi:glycosyltransferase family 2 protein [Capnocytophaga canis]|uniref:Glycosyl transferase family protein n=1 Tax=Capnocytophaga canis TaxID=1848903 RepID=A0A0B7IQ08_9FLAO|nr:glycosyltransferase family 2 protein [Capnocytophaga canis]CEN53976.1 Glycosyl transferase family protein [Capnocytophaga canis]
MKNGEIKVLLSIIIPAYNVAHFLKQTVYAIVKEMAFPEQVEVLIINDGSTDNTQEIIEQLKTEVQRNIVNSYQKTNGGLSDARNVGIKEARGEYVWFFDADDFIEEGSLSKILFLLKRQDIDLLSFGMRECYQDGRKEKVVNIDNKPSNIVIGGITYLSEYEIDYSSCVFVVRKEILIKNNLFFLKGVLSEDYEFNLRLYKYCNSITHIKDVFYNYMIRTGSLSRRANDDYFRFHHQSMCKILQNLYNFVAQTDNKDYSKALTKHITKIKLVVLGTLLKSILPMREKKMFYSKLRELDVLFLKDSGSVKKTLKQTVIVFLVNTKTYYFVMLLLSKMYDLRRLLK